MLGLDGVSRVECSIVSASRHFIETSLVIALYELLVGVMMRLRDDKRRRIAEYVYRKGLIDILESLEKRRTTVILC